MPKPRPLVPFLAGLVAALILVLVPTAALAKGATAARIDGGGPGGPGNGPRGPITLRGEGEPGGGTALANLADASGVFPAVYGQDPDPMLDTAPVPAAQLGPRATITWTVPDGGDVPKLIRQDAYPYAAGGPLTYMPPGQAVFAATTRGGWYQAPDSLRTQLIALGLPKRAPLTRATPPAPAPQPVPAPKAAPAAPAAPAPGPAAWPGVLAGAAALLLVLAGAFTVVRRRRPGAATAR
jgi:hypothetical protein